MLRYVFVRGGVHAMACARALKTLTGVKMTKLLPIPNQVGPNETLQSMAAQRAARRGSPPLQCDCQLAENLIDLMLAEALLGKCGRLYISSVMREQFDRRLWRVTDSSVTPQRTSPLQTRFARY